ncbi:MAG: type restriction enzyme subunit [Clostridiales bacterium]|nr:type restriction enzyme subunit [Clostridiales bacterium]MDN5282844.1 type restriction enzyme subunit [Candidatus Ozemobacter sp.]
MKIKSPNFEFIEEFDPFIFKLAISAEKYCLTDPVAALVKLRILGENITKNIASHFKVYFDQTVNQNSLLKELKYQNLLPQKVEFLFHTVKNTGNRAAHEGKADIKDALQCLRYAHMMTVYFYRILCDKTFKAEPFQLPASSDNLEDEYKQQLEAITAENEKLKQQIVDTTKLSAEEKTKRLKAEQEKKELWQQLQQTEQNALAKEAELEAEKAAYEQKLETIIQESESKSESALKDAIQTANEISDEIELSEAETRKIIDQQLRVAGWMADSDELRYSNGSRPEKGKNKAIAEWPTKSGPADYVLFVGLQPLAIVEAKKNCKSVYSAIDQAKRYSKDFKFNNEIEMPEFSNSDAENNPHKIPFVFATNGRPFLRQFKELSGIWFCDVRRPQNLRKPLEGWYSPEGLQKRLRINLSEAEKKLAELDFKFDFQLRKYQEKAIRRVEEAILAGEDAALLAMATGTGKTKTSIALIYRLLKAQRFKRILFLVDRSSLGEQAANAFKDTEIKGTKKFADIFGIKELKDKEPDIETSVQIATVQSMVKRVLYASDEATKPSIDQFDCIIVDECHRGYLLDKGMTDSELQFRDGLDYISKYRRVLDYFDAFKIALTATPALHTSEIFGKPVYTYSYREAVIDGFLIDHEPPLRLITHQSENGISWQEGEPIKLLNVRKNKVEQATTPDQLDFEVSQYNSSVLTPGFNKAVAEWLATHLNPASEEKTLIFCVNDRHADNMCFYLKEAMCNKHGDISDDMIMKITGAADKPSELIRRYKNEKFPSIAVTVDLLTTGIDVPKICNLVFVRKVNSRILYEQMLGRATRLCEELNKETFKIYDAVDIYENLQAHTEMKPVVVNPKISFAKLEQEIVSIDLEEAREIAREQFVTKLRRKKFSENSRDAIAQKTGLALIPLLEMLRNSSLEEVKAWFEMNPGIGKFLDKLNGNNGGFIPINEKDDEFKEEVTGYGNGKSRPEDYIESFKQFIEENRNEVIALNTVLTKPSDLTRKDLKKLKLLLDKNGYSEAYLGKAFQKQTNAEVAAGIIGYIRKASLGDPLKPYSQRVDAAIEKILKKYDWNPAQKKWLLLIAKQMKAEFIVDDEAFKTAQFRDAGGFNRINKAFDGKLKAIITEITQNLWQKEA